MTRKGPGRRHQILPLPHEIMTRARRQHFEVLTPIVWSKVANRDGQTGRNSAFLGKPYQPNGIVNSTREYIVMFRKPGYRRPSMTATGLSMLQPDEVVKWQHPEWRDVPGVGTGGAHPAPFPEEIAYRLIRLFSFAGDWIVDAFAGSGTTLDAARRSGRNAVGVEAVADYAGVMAAGGPDRRAIPYVAEPATTSATQGPWLVCLDDAGLDDPGAVDRRGTGPLDVVETMRSQDVLVLRDVWRHVADVDQLRNLVNALVGRNLHLRAEAQGIDTRTDYGRAAMDGFRVLAAPPTRPPGRRPKLDAAAVERARALIADGMSVTDVAAELGVHRATLHRHL